MSPYVDPCEENWHIGCAGIPTIYDPIENSESKSIMGWPVDTQTGLMVAMAIVAGFLILKK